jgi:hypothetical protein
VPRSSNWSLPFRPTTQNFIWTSHLFHVYHMPHPSHPSWPDHPNDNIWWSVQVKVIYFTQVNSKTQTTCAKHILNVSNICNVRATWNNVIRWRHKKCWTSRISTGNWLFARGTKIIWPQFLNNILTSSTD